MAGMSAGSRNRRSYLKKREKDTIWFLECGWDSGLPAAVGRQTSAVDVLRSLTPDPEEEENKPEAPPAAESAPKSSPEATAQQEHAAAHEQPHGSPES